MWLNPGQPKKLFSIMFNNINIVDDILFEDNYDQSQISEFLYLN